VPGRIDGRVMPRLSDVDVELELRELEARCSRPCTRTRQERVGGRRLRIGNPGSFPTSAIIHSFVNKTLRLQQHIVNFSSLRAPSNQSKLSSFPFYSFNNGIYPLKRHISTPT
jgi:hypothetical protein